MLQPPRLAERARELAAVSHALAEAAPDLPSVLSTAVERVAAAFQAGCVLYTRSGSDPAVLDPVAVQHPDPEYPQLLRELMRRSPIRLGEGITGRVAESGVAEFVPRVDPRAAIELVKPEHRPLLQRFPYYSYIVVPLKARGSVLGALGLVSTSPGRHFDDEDWSHLQDLADRAALAIANAHLVAELESEFQRRREAEERMQHAQKLESLGVLAGGIAHDFNNLLVGILGNASLAREEMASDAPGAAALRQVEATARRASELTRQLLAYSGKGRFVVEPTDLSELVRDLGQLLGVTVSKKARIVFDCAEGLPRVDCDATQIRQVVMNLMANASDAIGDGDGTVTLRTGLMQADRDWLAETWIDDGLQPGPYVFVEVQDSGAGMDEATQRRIFDPFFSTKGAGRGLGLAAVLGIVRGHRGAIRLQSEPGRGSTVRVLFPPATPRRDLSGEFSVPPRSWRPAAGAPARAAARTILFADDEETVRSVASRVLERHGYQVIQAADGRQALELFLQRESEIDLVLLDLSMPELGGEEVLREMRRLGRDVPAVLSSGYSEQELRARKSRQGVSAFLQKPWSASELIALVESLLPGVLGAGG
jgi:signal transduction histidine kinase